MTGPEGMAQLVQTGVFPEDQIDDLLALADEIETRVKRGELTAAQGEALLDAHAERTVARRIEKCGPLSAAHNDLARAILLALDAKGPPS